MIWLKERRLSPEAADFLLIPAYTNHQIRLEPAIGSPHTRIKKPGKKPG